MPFFQKIIFQMFFNFYCNLPRKVKLFSFSNRNLQTPFSKRRFKILTGRLRPKCLISRSSLSKVCQKYFSKSEAKKSAILGLFSNIHLRNFDQFGKNVFFETSFFSKNRENEGLFLRAAPNFFQQKLNNIARFVCKN